METIHAILVIAKQNQNSMVKGAGKKVVTKVLRHICLYGNPCPDCRLSEPHYMATLAHLSISVYINEYRGTYALITKIIY